MTVNEAKSYMENLQISADCDLMKTLDFKATVIKALERVQEYEAIGSAEEFRALKAKEASTMKAYECISSFTVTGCDVLTKVQIQKGQRYHLMFSNPTHVCLTADNKTELRIVHEIFNRHFQEVSDVQTN